MNVISHIIVDLVLNAFKACFVHGFSKKCLDIQFLYTDNEDGK